MSKRKRSAADANVDASVSVEKKAKTANTKPTIVQDRMEGSENGAVVSQSQEELKLGDRKKGIVSVDEKRVKRDQSQQLWWKNRKDIVVDEDLEMKISSTWTVSDPVGGSLLNIDPGFSLDDEHILLAYGHSIRVYARATSLLLRTLQVGHKGLITAFTMSPQNSNQLFVSLRNGQIEQWDWVAGERLAQWNVNSKLYGLAVSSTGSETNLKNTVYTVENTNQQWMIIAHHLHGTTASEQTESRTLFTSKEPITCFELLKDGHCIVASAGKRLIIGTKRATNKDSPSLKDLFYVWRELQCSDYITTMNSRLTKENTAPSKGTKKGRPTASLDIVVGSSQGSLFLYRDIVNQLVQVEQKKQSMPLTGRLHWHRSGVGAVKWSADGNYLISGGAETVLVLWQLDTGHKQSLPHLSAPIESIVVSPSGASYAIRLGDNSAMVLSTSELQPTANVSGILLPFQPRPTSSRSGESKDLFFRRPAISCLKTSPSYLLLAAPAAMASPVSKTLAPSQSCSYLQTFDARLGVQVSKQALVRTKVTDRNQGPEGNVVDEPNVVLLQVGGDSKWLATVEEWMPPFHDLYPLSTSPEETLNLQNSRMETYLKFWSRNDESGTWELVSRIDGPHSSSDQSISILGAVLDLIADPLGSGFLTLGDDGTIKRWRPSSRIRTGTKVKGKTGEVLTSWGCRQIVPLPAWTIPIARKPRKHASRIAISEDGSLLVVAHSTERLPVVYTVDMRQGQVLTVLPNAFSGLAVGIGLIDRYMILVSDHMSVWDLVNQEAKYVLDLFPLKSSNSAGRLRDVHLALDQQRGTFAISIPSDETIPGTGSLFAVFDPSEQTPLFCTELPRPLKVLIPAETVRGYYAINDLTEVYVFTPKVTFSQSSERFEVEPPPVATGVHNLFGNGKRLLSKKESKEQESMEDTASTNNYSFQEDLAVIRQQQLTELFDHGQPFMLPTMINLFEQVTQAIIGTRQGLNIS